MPPLACSRCQRVNPANAAFCYFDGSELRSSQGAKAGPVGQLPQEFIFPSGRRCKSFDDLATGLQEEWLPARDMLRQGVFRQFFTTIGRHDLAKAAQEAMTQVDQDIGLTRLVGSLPVTTDTGPKLDLNPRRLVLGNMFAGEKREVQLTINNQGQGVLQGTLSVSEGEQWLKLGGSKNGQCNVKAPKQQQVVLQVNTQGLPAGVTYGGKLTVVTNGGVVEVPVRLDLGAHPYPKAPFQGARASREMAEKMRANPKGAVTVLESGDLSRWFSSNGWNYPIRGTSAKGVAGVQQFFEAMGLAKPPQVQLAPPEVRVKCKAGEAVKGQMALRANSRKWVYASVSSDAPWLKVLTPSVVGPQQAAIAFEVDPAQVPPGQQSEGFLKVMANGGQTLTARVRVDVEAVKSFPGAALLRPVFAMALAFLLLRLLLVPVVDFHARASATALAGEQTAKQSGVELPADSPARSFTGWLRVPWFSVFLGSGTLPEGFFGPGAVSPSDTHRFRDHFVSVFVRTVVLYTWWVGLILAPLVLWRRGGNLADIPWGAIAGTVLGVMAGATLACLVLLGDLIPHMIWGMVGDGSVVLLLLWIILALLCWTAMGAVLGLALQLLGPWGRAILAPVQQLLAGLCRLCGLSGLAGQFAPA